MRSPPERLSPNTGEIRRNTHLETCRPQAPVPPPPGLCGALQSRAEKLGSEILQTRSEDREVASREERTDQNQHRT